MISELTMQCLVLLFFVGAALAAPKNPSRIIGGESTTIEQYPYMSSMLRRIFEIYMTQACGGTLVTPTSVLSAAQCYDDDSPSDWFVRLGSTRATSGGTLHDVSSIILHVQYNRNTLENNVAIIKLASAATLSNLIGTARVAGPNYNLLDGTKVYAVGWGDTRYGGPPSEVLQHVDIDIVNQELCTERYAHLKTLPDYQHLPEVVPEMICAGILNFDNKDACEGDFGGPLVHNRDIIIGITSWGYQCGYLPYYPLVSVRVSSYSDWILKNA